MRALIFYSFLVTSLLPLSLFMSIDGKKKNEVPHLITFLSYYLNAIKCTQRIYFECNFIINLMNPRLSKSPTLSPLSTSGLIRTIYEEKKNCYSVDKYSSAMPTPYFFVFNFGFFSLFDRVLVSKSSNSRRVYLLHFNLADSHVILENPLIATTYRRTPPLLCPLSNILKGT